MNKQLSWQLRIAAVLVGMGTIIGVGLIVLGLALMLGDPGFLFAILPLVFLVLTTAGVGITTFSLALTLRLRRAEPGVRLQVALLGGCLAVSGLFVASGSAAAATLLVLYGAALLGLMTTPAAADDLGPWLARAPRRHWFGRRRRPQQGKPAALPQPWWETWQAGLAQGMPLWELVLVGAAMLAFLLGLLSLPFGFALFPAIRALSTPLILGAVAVVWFVEQRMKTRLARR